MAKAYADRVQEFTSTSGTGAFALAGATDTTFTTFASAPMVTGDTCDYVWIDPIAKVYEEGVGTYDATANTLARTTVTGGSNGASHVNCAGNAGSYVFLTLSAAEVKLILAGLFPAPLGTPQDMTASGAIDTTKSFVILDSTTAAIAATLASGTKDGQEIFVAVLASAQLHSIAGHINEADNTVYASSPNIGVMLTFKWSSVRASWYIKNYDGGYEISDLPNETSLAGTDTLEVRQGAVNRNASLTQLVGFFSANLADLIHRLRVRPTALAYSATMTVDCSTVTNTIYIGASYNSGTDTYTFPGISGNLSLTLTNLQEGQELVVVLFWDATGSTGRTLTLGGTNTRVMDGGSAYAPSAGANGKDLLAGQVYGGVWSYSGHKG